MSKTKTVGKAHRHLLALMHELGPVTIERVRAEYQRQRPEEATLHVRMWRLAQAGWVQSSRDTQNRNRSIYALTESALGHMAHGEWPLPAIPLERQAAARLGLWPARKHAQAELTPSPSIAPGQKVGPMSTAVFIPQAWHVARAGARAHERIASRGVHS